MGFADGFDAAFVGGVFSDAWLGRLKEAAPHPGECQRQERENKGYASENNDEEIRIRGARTGQHCVSRYLTAPTLDRQCILNNSARAGSYKTEFMPAVWRPANVVIQPDALLASLINLRRVRFELAVGIKQNNGTAFVITGQGRRLIAELIED